MNHVTLFLKSIATNLSTVSLVCIIATTSFYFSSEAGNSEAQIFKTSLAAIVAFRILLFLVPAAFLASVLGMSSIKRRVIAVSGSALVAVLLFLIDNPFASEARNMAEIWMSFGGKLIFYEICWLISFVLAVFIGTDATSGP